MIAQPQCGYKVRAKCFMIDTYHCPKCSRELAACGVATGDTDEVPIFQCDHCHSEIEAFGDTFKVAFTFAVNPDGSWFEPAKDGL